MKLISTLPSSLVDISDSSPYPEPLNEAKAPSPQSAILQGNKDKAW